MWIHLHIPKNAGTTFRHILDRSFGDAHYSIYDRYNTGVQKYRGHFGTDELRGIVDGAPKGTEILSGHHVMMLDQDESEERGLQYLTWIRHPAARVLSLYHYERKWAQLKPEIYGNQHIALGSFDQYVRTRMDRDDHLDDWQCLDLSGQRSFEYAKDFLDRCDAVGVVERFDDSLLVFRCEIGPAMKLSYQKQNTAGKSTVLVSQISKDTSKLILNANKNNLKLFEYANARLDQRLEAVRSLTVQRFRMRWANLSFRTVALARNTISQSSQKLKSYISLVVNRTTS